MTTVTIPLNLVKSLASMITFTNKDNGRLDRVYVEVLPHSITALASDRYAIIESIYTERNGDGKLNFQITAEIAKFITGIKIKLADQPIEITLNESGIQGGRDLTISMLGQSATFANSQLGDGDAMFAKLTSFAETTADGTIAKPVTLDVALLSRCAKLIGYNGKKIVLWQFHLGQADAESTKPAPITAYAKGVISWQLLQMPNLDR